MWPTSGHKLYLNPLQKTECQPGVGRPLPLGAGNVVDWFPGRPRLHSGARLLAAEHAAIKEVFELGLMVVLCFEMTVY